MATGRRNAILRSRKREHIDTHYSAMCKKHLQICRLISTLIKDHVAVVSADRQEDSMFASDVAFTPAVKSIQANRGSREHYGKRDFRTAITPDLAAFIAARNSFYLATANAGGQPYVQHRGGPLGFLQVLDEHTLGFADFRGNRQYITLGNLKENDRAFIFLMDHAHQARVKLWGHARVVENDPDLLQRLAVPGYKAMPEQAILFRLTAWDPNCRQHIPQLFAPEDVADAVQKLQARIAELEAELARARGERA
jgi:uncharacterized protein